MSEHLAKRLTPGGAAPEPAGGGAQDDQITLLACQIDVPPITSAADRDAHVERVAAALERELSENGSAGLIILPELSTLHYSRECFETLAQTAEDLETSPTLARLGEVAKRYKSPILVGLARIGGQEAIYISQVLIGPDGAVQGCYDKLHIAQFGDSMEKEFFTAGDHIMVFKVGGFTFGTLICYDIRSPEFSRTMVRQHGVDVLLHPTAFCRDESFHTWHAFATVRAVENQVYFASVNRAGQDFGDSVLMEPWIDESVPVKPLGTEETFARWTIERAKIDYARKHYPFLKDARDDYNRL